MVSLWVLGWCIIKSVRVSPYVFVHCCGLSTISGLQATTEQATARWTHSCLDTPVMQHSTQSASLFYSAFLILEARKSSQIQDLFDLPQQEQMPLDPTLLISPPGVAPTFPSTIFGDEAYFGLV